MKLATSCGLDGVCKTEFSKSEAFQTQADKMYLKTQRQLSRIVKINYTVCVEEDEINQSNESGTKLVECILTSVVNECKSAVRLQHFYRHAHIQTTRSAFHPPDTQTVNIQHRLCVCTTTHTHGGKQKQHAKTKALTHTYFEVCVTCFYIFSISRSL